MGAIEHGVHALAQIIFEREAERDALRIELQSLRAAYDGRAALIEKVGMENLQLRARVAALEAGINDAIDRVDNGIDRAYILIALNKAMGRQV